MKRLILASASPRRKQLLSELIPHFEVVVSRYEEKGEGLPAAQTVERFAFVKASEVFSRYPDCLVLGADTVVSLDGKILGKPRDEEDAKATLRRLSGRTHEVYTGVCLMGEGVSRVETVCSKVKFYPLSEELIEEYVQSGLPLDKAGSYGIQDGFPLVEGFEGSYSNVVGLPMEYVKRLLEEEGLC